MGRPPTPLGTAGKVTVKHIAPSKYRARARYRNLDGTARFIVRFGQTMTEARGRVALAVAAIQSGQAHVDRHTTVTVLARRWLDEEVDADPAKGAQTREHYRYAVTRYIVPALGSLTIGEASTSRCDAALRKIAAGHGDAAARTCRSVMRGMFGMAIRHDALTVNPVRETRPINTVPKRGPARALTPDEVDELTDALRADPRAVLLDLPDLVEFGLATGCRIGEALAVREAVLDLDAGTVEVNATAIRLKGRGVVIQERPKTSAGHRVLALPPFAVAMLLRRREELRLNPPAVRVLDAGRGLFREERVWVAFPAPLARSVRDPSNTASDMRAAFDRAGFEWVTFHTLRKTVATRLDAAGMTPTEVANQLGHAQPSMTLDRYMGRKVVSARAASVLDR